MKFEDMGPGPQPAAPSTGENGHDHANLRVVGSDRGDAFRRPRPAAPGVTHPDQIKAAIRMLAEEGYRVFRASDVKRLTTSYAIRPSMTDSPEFEQLARDRVLQDISINVATSPAVSWSTKEREDFGRLLEAAVLVVVPEETAV